MVAIGGKADIASGCSNRPHWPIATDRILVAERRFRGHNGHGWSGGRPDPDANDPKRTLGLIDCYLS
jgi:hypothetical protein